MTTTETSTSMIESKNLAQQIMKSKTPIAVAVGEYIRSLLHSTPNAPYIFGKVSQTSQVVSELLPRSEKSSEAANDTQLNKETEIKKAA